MRILIVGGDGMLGHQLLRSFRARHDVRVTLRQDRAAYSGYSLFSECKPYFGVDAREYTRMLEVVGDFQPDAIVNCVGVVKQRAEAKASIPSLEINALLPHRLALLARAAGCRLVHLSTDCVFSGREGAYTEDHVPDAEDLYGRSKLLGEVDTPGCITLRTSIIGLELKQKTSLVEWFIAQKGKKVKGFCGAIYSGFTTMEMARIIESLLVEHPQAHGLYHVSSEPISKYELLLKINNCMNLNIEVEPEDEFRCDRSLDSARFRSEFGYRPPTWDEMADELGKEYRRD